VHLGVVVLPELPWAESQHRWRLAEELGFEHAWTYDHLTWRSFRDLPWYGAVPTLAAAASATERLRLGTLVASPNFRHPLTLAKELITLDDISGGRLIAGIGAGGSGWDATVLGHEPWSARERGRRFAEFVALTDLLLREPAVTWRGDFYAVEDARTFPGCTQEPRLPLAIAASGPAGMQLAARYGDYWVTIGDPATGVLSPAEGAGVVREQIGRLHEACARFGRGPASIRKLVLTGLHLDPGLSSPEAFRATVGRYEEAGATDLVVHWPRPSEPFAGELALFERIVSS
jgi:alkanesulfonate monooxygenase SsuD/methylene tetrahydromethanopterin reductase-like flavin-dependent oxidoreductase (luciferase family)